MIFMDLAVIAGNIFGWGKAVFDSFTVTFGDLTINGWLLLIVGVVEFFRGHGKQWKIHRANGGKKHKSEPK